ncbi:sulfurtransferase TusA family protein [Natronomonas sp. LN261]|jgi:tRNA 2-thiouridine synthesizing protein A|uniref:sulfurtransferase TusA family protein n=1 Tax=Natronomonas sp. LN261 TaxID=2750669 RepID=UPI0015EE50EC|nr:sulfurtransferase TusA family protein [Natronomonas sp. LN261]
MTVIETDIDADATVDARGSSCPGPLMDLIGKIRDLETGDVVVLLSDGEESLTDVPEWAEESGNRVLEIVEGDEHNEIYVEKS